MKEFEKDLVEQIKKKFDVEEPVAQIGVDILLSYLTVARGERMKGFYIGLAEATEKCLKEVEK